MILPEFYCRAVLELVILRNHSSMAMPAKTSSTFISTIVHTKTRLAVKTVIKEHGIDPLRHYRRAIAQFFVNVFDKIRTPRLQNMN